MRPQTIRDISLISLTTGILIYIIWGALALIHHHPISPDFRHFYMAAQAVLAHNNIYSSGEGGYIYPPLLAVLLSPLAHLTYIDAFTVWMMINIILLAISLGIGFRIIANGFKLQLTSLQILSACGLAILLSYNSLRWEILLGQTDLLILAAISLGLYWLDKRPWLAGFLFAVSINIKYYALVFLPFLCLRRRWKTVAGLLIGTLILAFLPAIILGWKTNWSYLQIALKGIIAMNDSSSEIGRLAKVPLVTWYRNITITSGLTRIFLEMKWDISYLYLTLAGLLAVLFIFFLRMFRSKGIDLLRMNQAEDIFITQIEWYSFWICLLAFSPQNTLRHLVLMINVNLIAAVMLMFPLPGVKRWPVALGLIIMELGTNLRLQPQGHSIWQFIGGPGWTLLPFIFIITSSAITYFQHQRKILSLDTNA